MRAFEKTNYFYIDEAGHLNNDSSVFVLGCIKTDTPEELLASIDRRFQEIKEDPYYEESIDDILAKGLHAVENHPDIRTEFYKLLPRLNFRAYFVVVNKNETLFKEQYEIDGMAIFYGKLLSALLRDRVIKKSEKYILNVEDLEFSDTKMSRVLDTALTPLKKGRVMEYYIVGKGDRLIGLIDYLNYLLFTLIQNPKKEQPRFEQSFKLLAPKIGLIHYWNTNKFISRHQKIELNKILYLFDGKTSG